MDCIDSTKAIDMSLDEIIQYNDPHMAYDAHAEYFLCNNNQQSSLFEQNQGHGESEPSKCKKRRRFCTQLRQKNSRFTEVTNRRFINEENDAQFLEEGECSQPPPYAQNTCSLVPSVKMRLGRPRYQKNQDQGDSNQGQGHNRNRYYQRNYQEGLTVQISNSSHKIHKREIRAVMSLEITAHSN